MKVKFTPITLLLIALFSISSLSAQEKEKHEPKYKKNKSYSKSYSLSSSDKIELSNQFGEMKLVTWDKNEIKVDATITAKSDDEQRAQEILDRIGINDSKSGGTVSFTTKFKDEKKTWNKKEKGYSEGMEINYLVYLPAGNTLNASNQFGKMIVPDYNGEATLTSKFGSLTAGKITNGKEVNVEFGEAEIQQLNGGRLTIKFSEGTVKKLGGTVRSNLEFSQVKLEIDNDARSLEVDNSYSTVYLDLDKNMSATYNIHTSHGDFINKTSFNIKKEEEEGKHYGPDFTSQYNGTSGNGACKIKVKSSFGEIIAGHDMQVDLSEKKKHKGTKAKTI
ncbi:MAG: hypothetical protein JNM88_13920 [Chitinophagaceae bacterium]|nr:hypothetical protein [Chitinophagaceae bacterium]